MFNRVTALNWCQKLVFAQYLKNGWTEFNQILYTLYHWQNLCLYGKRFIFCKFDTELQLLIYVRNCFLLNILRMDGQNLTKFCIHITIDKVWVGIVFFFHFCKRATALDWYQNWWLLNILRMDGQNLTKFCIDIFFDKIYVGKIKRHYSQILLNILIMNVENLIKLCIYITIDMIYPPSVLQTGLCSWTYLCPLIVLWRGYRVRSCDNSSFCR